MFNYIGLIFEWQIRFFLEAAEKANFFEDMIKVLDFIEDCKTNISIDWYI